MIVGRFAPADTLRLAGLTSPHHDGCVIDRTFPSRRTVLGGVVIGTGITLVSESAGLIASQGSHKPSSITLGINEGFLSNDATSDPRGVPDILSDWSLTGNWRVAGSYAFVSQPDTPVDAQHVAGASVDMGYDGVIHAPGRYLFVVGPSNAPEHQGKAKVTFAPGTQVTGITGGATSTSFFGRVVTFVAPSFGAQHVVIDVTYDGSNPTGLTASLAGPGVGGDFVTTAAFRANMAASRFKAWRPMTPLGINNDTIHGTTNTNIPLRTVANRWTGRPGMGPLTVELAVAIANEARVDLHWNESHLSHPELVSYHANYIATHLHPDLGCAVEHSNEVWNTAFSQYAEVMLQGIRAGFCLSSVETMAQSIPIKVFDGRSIFNPQTRIASQNVQAGEKVFVAIWGYGWAVYVAKRNTESGLTLPDPRIAGTGGGDENFSLLYDFNACELARLRQHAQRTSILIGRTFKDAFAQAHRPRPTIRLGAHFVAFSSIEPAVQWIRAANGSIDEICIAPYFGYVGSVDTADRNAADLSGWSSVEKALYATDVDGWKNGYFGVLDKAIQSTLEGCRKYASDLDAENVAARGQNGNANGDIKLGFYEVGLNGFSNYGTPQEVGDPRSTISLAVQSLVRDPRMGSAWEKFLEGVSLLGVSKVDIFYRVGALSGFSPWAMAESERDFDLAAGASTNWRIKGVADFVETQR